MVGGEALHSFTKALKVCPTCCPGRIQGHSRLSFFVKIFFSRASSQGLPQRRAVEGHRVPSWGRLSLRAQCDRCESMSLVHTYMSAIAGEEEHPHGPPLGNARGVRPGPLSATTPPPWTCRRLILSSSGPSGPSQVALSFLQSRLGLTVFPEGSSPTSNSGLFSQKERRHGLAFPIAAYPIFEQSLRAAQGLWVMDRVVVLVCGTEVWPIWIVVRCDRDGLCVMATSAPARGYHKRALYCLPGFSK